MRKLAVAAAALGALGACGPVDTWSNRVEEPPAVAHNPEIVREDLILSLVAEAPFSERWVRRPPDFRLYDAAARKEYWLYLYEAAGVRDEFVLVLDHEEPPASRRLRLATAAEDARAWELFRAEWAARGDERRLRYFNERHAREQARRATALEQAIVYKEAERRDLEEQALALRSDLASRRETGAYAAGDEKLSLPDAAAVERRLAGVERRLAEATAELFLLRYRRALRDGAPWAAGTPGK
jgi:hypothetical protein